MLGKPPGINRLIRGHHLIARHHPRERLPYEMGVGERCLDLWRRALGTVSRRHYLNFLITNGFNSETQGSCARIPIMLTQALARYKPQLRLILRGLAIAVAGVVVMAAASLLLIRFWLWPSMPQWQEGIVSSAQAELSKQGLVLTVGPVTADWESWIAPRLRVGSLEMTDAAGQRVLSVGEINATLGPRSLAMLWHWQPIFSEIRLRNPWVKAQRGATGEITVAGLSMDQDTHQPTAIDWLLRQGRLRIDAGEMVWHDVGRERSIQMSEITLALNNLGQHHSWALRASLPAALGEGFALQGNFRHPLFGAPSLVSQWHGEAFVQFDRVNLQELFRFVHLPQQAPLQVNAGQGAMRAWVKLAATELEDLTVDLDLSGASLQWGSSGRKPMTLETLTGRVKTKLSDRQQHVTLEDVHLRSTQLAQPVSIPSAVVAIEQDPTGTALATRISSKSVDITAAMWLAEHLPIPEQWKKHVTELQPRGRLNDLEFRWQESGSQTKGFLVEARFEDLSLAPGQKRPGFARLSGRMKAHEKGGELSLESRSAKLIFPGIFPEAALEFDRLLSQATWTSKNLLAAEGANTGPEVFFEIKKASLENKDVAAEAVGTYQWTGEGLGRTALTGKVTRANPTQIYRYIPLTVGKDTRTWVQEALQNGKPYTAEFELNGPLASFPFRDPTAGRFILKAQAEGAALRPAPGWPLISGIRAGVVFDRHQFRIDATGARINDLTLTPVQGRIDDLESDRPQLVINGGLSGELQRLIEAVNQSPLRSALKESTVAMTAKAPANLSLSMQLDLDNGDRSVVEGKLGVGRGTFRFSPTLPEVTINSGDLSFNREGIQQLDLRGQAMGGPLRVRSLVSPATSRVAGTTAGKSMAFNFEGQATAAGLETWAEQASGFGFKNSLQGSTRYAATLTLREGVAQLVLNTSLEGLGSQLFGPFKKLARDDWGARLELIQTEAKTGSLAQQVWTIQSASQKINVRLNRQLNQRRETLVELDTPSLAGQLKWVPAPTRGPTRPPVLQAKLTKLWLDKPKPVEDSGSSKPSDDAAQNWPTVDLTVDDFRVGERRWGKLEAQASPVIATRSWEILRFAMTNPDAELTGQGQWSMLAGGPRGRASSRTTLDVELALKNGGALLARSGYPGVVKDTQGKIEGRLHWPGSPLDFSGSILSGNLSLNLQQGQFLKTEPGIARLVGVLNLQSLPRRIKLDFRDVFSEGFTYERIRGDLQFQNGQAATQNLRIIGVQASVMLEGSADIRRETQNLRVLVLPEVNAGLASLGYAALVNPAVGLGAFIAQYVLRNPVRELLSYEYKVTGGWDDPIVEPVKREMRSDPPEIRSSEK
jgi:uncharacterized protein YhdP